VFNHRSLSVKSIPRTLCGLVLAACTFAAVAGSSREDAVAQVNAAVAQIKKIGIEKAVEEFNADDRWKTGGMTVLVIDEKGVVHASSINAKLRGKTTLELKDPNGKEFAKEAMTIAATKGEGWVEFQFLNPESRKVVDRVMFVKKPPVGGGFVAVAMDKP
jgi:signal transduction histidine kinase